MTSTPEANNFIDDDEDEPSQDVILEGEHSQEVNIEEGESEQQSTPRTDMEIEVDKIPQEMKIRILKRYTNLSHNDIFRRTGTAPRTGRRMLSTLPPRKPGPGRTGRPPRLGQDLIQKMIEEISDPNSERTIDWQKLGKEYGHDVHKHTIRRAMEKAGYKKCLGCQKGYLTGENRAQRLQFAKDYLSCPRWQWDEVLYCDEMHFTYNKRKRGITEWSICEDKERYCVDCVAQKHKSGKAEFHVWSSISWNYKGPLVFYERSLGEGGFSEEFYRDGLLRVHVEPRHRVFRANGKGFVLLEENDGLHRTRAFGDPAWRYKDEIGLHFYTNPPNSFDFNPNVAIWRLLKERTKLPKDATKEELQWELQVEWDKITIEEINKEISSLQGRMVTRQPLITNWTHRLPTMAPIQGKRPTSKTPTGKAKSGSITNPRTLPTNTENDEIFKTTKKDKRTIKHSSFVSRIEKANPKAQKRRRPSKKLVADLESLANALPEDEDGETEEGVESGNAMIRHRSLKSRPGAMKRKEKLETMEKERFGKNMAQMVTGTATASIKSTEGSGAVAANGGGASSTRWAALRGFIQQTMEQKPEFRAA